MPFNVAAGNSSGYNYASGRLDHQTYYRAIRIDQAHLARTVLDRPQHPYSIALKAAVLSPDGTNEKTEVTSHA